MAYSELIKNFNRIRAYLRSFYVYGFMHREDFTQKSARSYDNERRRVESWLGDYMSFGQDADGRRVFLSVDSRAIPENPLYRAFRTKSFTDRDIMLHFHIMDILKGMGALSISELMDELAERLSEFDTDDLPDESTVRKKLKEYLALGLIDVEKQGREKRYTLMKDSIDLESWDAAAAFFSEAAPVGVIGSFLQDRLPARFQKIRFKHHYILNALDSEILCQVFDAIGKKRLLTLTIRKERITGLPLKVYIGTQTGRQYILFWSPSNKRFSFFRADFVDHVKIGEAFLQEREGGGQVQSGPGLEEQAKEFCSHVWGVASNNDLHLEHIEMTVLAGAYEGFIVERLEREKRCGTVEQVDETHWRFTADVYDALELLPWLRTFTGRVTELQSSNKYVETRFWRDVEEMKMMYIGGESHALP